MKRLSEFRGEEALLILADIIEPAAEIIGDKAMVELLRKGQMAKAAKVALKGHPGAVLEIMARLDGENPETYAPNMFALPMKLLEIFNDPELVNLFTSQGQTEEQTSSGSATVNTEAVKE